MGSPLTPQSQQELHERGFSRRQIGRISLMLGVGTIMAGMPWQKSCADPLPVGAAYPPDSFLLNCHSFWTGLLPPSPGS